VIGRPCKDVSEEEALSYVLGYLPANDVSNRAQQFDKPRSGGQFCRAKGFDTYCPLGPFLTLASAVPDPQSLTVRTRLNGKVMQDGNTSQMIFSVRRIISYLSESTTLLPGTVILTGTPAGCGWKRNPPVFLLDGDTVEVEIQGLGTLRNKVQFAK
jgi:2-keto-4-pentenoate hydratase/2-oxohepta-3-ene-1,7-dioic acid hydratase in catechol pathway